jgi:hypothetical protein
MPTKMLLMLLSLTCRVKENGTSCAANYRSQYVKPQHLANKYLCLVSVPCSPVSPSVPPWKVELLMCKLSLYLCSVVCCWSFCSSGLAGLTIICTLLPSRPLDPGVLSLTNPITPSLSVHIEPQSPKGANQFTDCSRSHKSH